MQLAKPHKQLFIYVSLFFSPLAYSGEVINSSVSDKDGVYKASLVMQINAPTNKVYALLTDYDELSGLSDNITGSELIDQDPPKYTVVVTIHNCVLFFCKSLSQTQHVHEFDKGYITVKDIKGKSDFIYAETNWHIYAYDKGTRVTFDTEMKPDFWLPPLLGPWIFRNAIIDEATNMINHLEKLAVNGTIRSGLNEQIDNGDSQYERDE